MYKLAGISVCILLAACSSKRGHNYQALEHIGVYQLDSLHGLKFDLSGIVASRDTIYVIADKPWNKFLYQIEFADRTFEVLSKKPLKFRHKLDLEGIDYCHDNFYIVNERQGIIYKANGMGEVEEIDTNLDSINFDPKRWGNAGWEGIAADCNEDVIYLIKEREPRMIFKADMSTGHILDKFTIAETESNDFSDAKYENGYLYVIERNGNFVTKIDVNKKTVVDKYHYQHIASHPDGKLYGPTEYGMGEALLLLKDEIWIGFDNNGLQVTPYAKKEFGMTGKSPAIIKFKRPHGF